jgi:GNAT superfamily N-acetyltransferase
VNLDVDLARLPRPEGGGTPAPHRAQLSDRTEILDFIAEHFGALWAYEASRAFANDPPTIFIARAETGRIAGFAAHEANNRGLAFFGPMGTDPATRGHGIGRALLLASLADLRARGASRAVISWAANLPFYERACGARPILRMVRFSKVLP